MTKIKDWVKANPKAAGLIATLAIAAGAYYGVPPGYVEKLLSLIGG